MMNPFDVVVCLMVDGKKSFLSPCVIKKSHEKLYFSPVLL